MEQLDGSGDLEVKLSNPCMNAELKKDLSVLNQKNVMLEQVTDKQESGVLKAVKQSTLEAPDPPFTLLL